MIRAFVVSMFLGAALVTSGCANSVLNDPEEMARRHASVQRDQARRDRFWGRFSGPSASQAPSGGNSSTLYQSSARTPSQCRAIGGTWNTASNFCWRI